MQIEMDTTIVELVRKLRAQAEARRIPFDVYLERFVEAGEPGTNGNVSMAEFDHILDELAALPPALGSLPGDFSRADVYTDHD